MIRNAVNAPSAREGDDDELTAIRAIQADALRHAAELSRITSNFHTGGVTALFRTFAVRLEMEVKALEKP